MDYLGESIDDLTIAKERRVCLPETQGQPTIVQRQLSGVRMELLEKPKLK